MDSSKKILYGLAGFVILSTVAFGVYLLFFSNGSSAPATEDGANTFPVDGDGGGPVGPADSGNGNIPQEGDMDEEKMSFNENAIRTVYKWQYGGKFYTIIQNLYASINDYYKSQPKEYVYFTDIPVGTEDAYFGKFLVKMEESDFFNDYYGELVDAIVLRGKNNNLSDDQMVELAVAFAQHLPYDDSKAAHIRMKTAKETINYPYETLSNNRGVSFDKSLLLVAILRELGYGAAIFTYNATNHMAVGIQCPIAYSAYNSGYCFAETTNVKSKIGMIPKLDSYAGKAVVPEGTLNSSQSVSSAAQTTKAVDLGAVRIYQKTTGKEYRGIVEIAENNIQAAAIKKDIDAIEKKIAKMQSGLAGGDSAMDSTYNFQDDARDLQDDVNDCVAAAADDPDKIAKCINDMNDEVNDMKDDASDDQDDWMEDALDDISDYGNLIREYNRKIQEYNSLVGA